MRLPNVEDAIVETDKVASYLLSQMHTTGRGKAKFFTSFGFSSHVPEELRHALLRHAMANDVASLQQSEYGTKYAVEGPLPAPDGRAPVIRSVWIIESGMQKPRFVTAFPGRR